MEDLCQKMIGPAYSMTECRRPVEFLTAEDAQYEGMQYSGWYHADRTVSDHHAVKGVYAR